MNNLTIRRWQLLLLILFTTSLPVQATMDFVAYKIVNVTRVNLSSQPKLSENKIGNTLPLGTITTTRKRTVNTYYINGKTDYWYYIEINRNLKGWIFGSALSNYSSKNRESIYLNILQQRLSQKTATFDDVAASYQLIGRVLPTIMNYNFQAQFKLTQLLTLQKSLDLISSTQQKTSPQQQWLQQHRQQIVFDKASARWLIIAKIYWKLADYYANHSISDQLAWQAASAPLAGHCKADIECTLQRELATNAAYLQRSPGGAYVNFALSKLKKTLLYITLTTNAKKSENNSQASIRQSIKALTQIVTRTSTNAQNRTTVLAQLKTLQTRYNKVQ